MGTSQSSPGPGGGVPLVPPWTPDLPAPDPKPDSDEPAPDADSPDQTGPGDGADGSDDAPDSGLSPTAPGNRFQRAKISLGTFSKDGDRQHLRRALRHYVSSGYGGSGTTTRRFGGTVATAATLGNVLAGLASGTRTQAEGLLDRALLTNASARDIMNAIIDAARPVDGTLDAEAERASINDALSDLMDTHPDADLLNLDEEQRSYAIERFAANDVFRRFELDLGKVIVEKASTNTVAASRLKEAGDYVRESVIAAFRTLRDAGKRLTGGAVASIVRQALQDTFVVFEEYLG